MEHIWHAPAKVNLLLKVLSKRDDGYHNIYSVVDIISLHDVLRFEDDPSGKVDVTDDKGLLPEGPKNTVYRAITSFKERFGIDRGMRVLIEKNIPIGSGLGGPSSDAATALKAVNALWEVGAPEKDLMELGASVGADVPLFLYGKPCVMEGIGEKITPVSLPTLHYIVIYPNVSVSTAEVYKRLRIVLTKKEKRNKLDGKLVTAFDVSRILENDLENVGILMCPTIEVVKERLIASGSVGALMSGSGSSVFGIFETKEKAEMARVFLGGLGSLFIVHSK